MKLFKKAKKGFTLVELVVVIAVIAILSAVSVGAYFGITDSANGSKCTTEAKSLHTAMSVLANDPNVEGIDITKNGIDIDVETCSKVGDDGEDIVGLDDILLAETGITYDVKNTLTNSAATTDPTLYVIDGDELGYYSVVNKIASINWATGEVKIVSEIPVPTTPAAPNV